MNLKFIFQIFVEKIKVPLKYDKNNYYFTQRPMNIYDNTSLKYSENEKLFRQKL